MIFFNFFRSIYWHFRDQFKDNRGDRRARKMEAPKVTKVMAPEGDAKTAGPCSKGGNRALKKGKDGSAKGAKGMGPMAPMAPEGDAKTGGPMTKGGSRALKKGEDGSAKGDKGVAPEGEAKTGGPGPKGGRALL
jgi:hypothetical protein